MGFGLIAQALLSGSNKSLTKRLGFRQNPQSSFKAWFLDFRKTLRTKLSPTRNLRRAVSELPEILELMSVSLAAGDGLFGALARVVPRANGVVADALKKIVTSLEFGADLDSELQWLARHLPQRQVVEFSSKLSIALNRGTPLAQMLRSLAESTRAEIRNDLLKQAGRNETRMLVPLVFLILPVTVLFAVYPSLQLLNIDYI